ncbi:MAG: RnfABCDGE type electron transport complex subunit B [Spirochaetes bacterium]|nr:RnfABCDGE type electron transport complex subunit B [Spirochaetota bacterium]
MFDMIFPSLPSLLTLIGLAFLFGLLLSVARLKLVVKKDPRVLEILDALPGANCGACGLPGCSAYATKIVEEKFQIDLCPVGGGETADAIARIMGVEPSGGMKAVTARVHCRGGHAEAGNRFLYEGPRDCDAAHGAMGGPKICEYGCLGFGNCAGVCPFDALHMNDNGIPVVDFEKCTGCGKCVTACPRGIISLEPKTNDIFVMCMNQEKAPVMKKGCTAGCIACKLCEKACRQALAERSPEKDPATIELAITVENFLARINYDLCIQCYRCVEVCPVPVIHPLERSKKYQKKEPDRARKVEVKEEEVVAST